MAKATFMSMRWLRLHIKEIIWATVILFVLSCFLIGYGTSRAQRQSEERKKRAESAEKRKAESEEIPMSKELKSKMPLPAVHISLPTQTASVTRVLDLKTVYRALTSRDEYRKCMTIPAPFRGTYLSQIKESVLQQLIMTSLAGLYAEANNLKPQTSAEALVEMDKKKIGPDEMDRMLRKEGMSPREYGSYRMQQETLRMVLDSVTRPLPPASVSEDFLKNYYETNKIRFKKDDELELHHLLLAPAEFQEVASISIDDMRKYFDEHRSEFKSSYRASVFHILINPNDNDYLNAIPVSEGDIRMRYSDKIGDFKKAEEVNARHILIKPKNSFEKQMENCKMALRHFTLKELPDDKYDCRFEANISEPKSSINIGYNNISLITADGKSFNPTPESQKDSEHPLVLPFTGSPATRGEISINFPKSSLPPEDAGSRFKIVIKDGDGTYEFDISSAFDEEKSFAAAEAEAKSLLERVTKNKDDFAKIASECSEDEGSKKDGGDLKFFTRGKMAKAFEDAAFAAQVGEIVGPVKSKFGYHLIKVEAHNPEKTKSLEEVRGVITAQIKAERADLKAQSDLDTARESVIQQSRTFKEVMKEYSMASSRKNDGKIPPFFKGEITEDYASETANIIAQEIGDEGRIIQEIEEAIFATNSDGSFALKPKEMTSIIKTSKGYHLFELECFQEPINFGFTESVKGKIKSILEEKLYKQLAENKAKEIAGKITAIDFDKVASEAHSAGAVKLGPLPFSFNPGFSNYALSSTMGQLSMDGQTYLPKIHGVLAAELIKPEYEKRVIGPIETELGFHFILVSSFTKDLYQPYDEVKTNLKNMLVQEPSIDAIKAEFEKSKEKFDKPAMRKIRQILVAEEEIAKDLYKRLQSGEIFSLLAKRYSIDGSSANGGLMGEIKRGQLPANVDEEVWKLKKGEYTPPLQTSYGWLIVSLEDNESPGKKAEWTDIEIQDKLKKKLREGYREDFLESFMTGLKNKAHIIRHQDLLAEL